MSEADKIIESLKNSGRKVEEFYTGNKGSDKNVGSIEKNIANKRQKYRKQATKMSQTSDKNVAKVTKSDIDILNALIYVYEARLPNYNELMDSEVKSLKNILAEREQKDKRIKELEADLYSANEIIADLTDSIPKQVVIDKIEEIEIIKQITSKAKYTHLELLQFAINNLEELLEK